MKGLSKKIGVTINDIMASALSAAMYRLFKENGDPNKEIKLLVPANIRFEFYHAPEEIKLENKFAVLPVTLPLTENMSSAYPKVQKVTKFLKESMALVYAMYALTFYANIFCPRIIPLLSADSTSKKFTMAFSNTPGPIKPFLYSDSAGNTLQTQ